MPTRSRSRSQFTQVRHAFYYRVAAADGTSNRTPHKVWAKVRKATQPVDIVLTPEHVRKAIRLDGAGRTDICAGAVCAVDHRNSFPHPVEGHVDFQYSRAFVVTKTKNGLPSECVVYDHRMGWLAKLNDTKGGLPKLLERVAREGSVTITLRPHRKRSVPGRSGTTRQPTGARNAVPHKGARLRYAVYQLGGIPA